MTSESEKVSVQVVPATMDDFERVTNLSRFYVYDMSEHMGWRCPESGLWGGCDEFFDDWQNDRNIPYIIRVGRELAGFAGVKRLSETPSRFCVQEFFIMRKFRRKGMGKQVAHWLFDTHRGDWEVEQLSMNTPSIEFWRAAIAEYTNDRFAERIRPSKWGDMNVIEFHSK